MAAKYDLVKVIIVIYKKKMCMSIEISGKEIFKQMFFQILNIRIMQNNVLV